jgi:hypothetical protein
MPADNDRPARVRRLPELTAEEELQQGISFVYGNLHIENPEIERESVARMGEEIAKRVVNELIPSTPAASEGDE